MAAGATMYDSLQGGIQPSMASGQPESNRGSFVEDLWSSVCSPQALHAQVLQNLHDAVIVTDQAGRIKLWNRGAEAIYGYSADEAVGQHIGLVYLPEDVPLRESLIIEPLLAKGEHELEFRARHRSGARLVVNLSLSLLRDDSGNPIGIIGVSTDITARRRLDEQLQRHQAELAHVARLATLGEMATGLAHELNQPLAAIVNYTGGCAARLRSGTWSPDELLAAIEEAGRQAERAGEILRRVRNFVRKDQPRRTPLSVNEAVAEALRFVAGETRDRAVRVSMRPAEPPPWTVADHIQIEQVLLNLIRNGFEAMESVAAARRELAVEVRTGDRTVEVAVNDTGVGLPPGPSEQVFTAFYTTKPQGLGMGLSISRSIIEAHGGRLWAVPRPEGGTSFRFVLPAFVRNSDDPD